MKGLNLKPSMLNTSLWKHHTPNGESANCYKWPQKEFIKLNFEGAAKGNPGAVGTGGLFKDNKGKTLRVYVMDCRNATNNEA